ncbi:PAS domain S-box-containing protein [Thermosyntropha lipolytica DSM 11003]|uniref:HTH-type transcriptional regulatory protein TyrR n=1 Tax=Thermosyntropha lipolytica DSM 11003 TaxID=1123382 RepID=A0A1M5LUC7_9FIRM|nr:sigma 54-interacting transcriptional regulator [Thermosyntropha lipolytica]SHG68595.1 PAS domain S-box-containing protein [Thermosyntropha lipolytica DSM 11003]
MKVKEFMTRDVVCIDPDATLEEVAQIFLERKIDGVPVVDGEGKLVGLITKTHLIRAIKNHLSYDSKVKDVMTVKLVTVTPEKEIKEIIEEYQIGRLPVVEQGRLVGIITRTDIMWAYYSMLEELNSFVTALLDSMSNPVLAIDRRGVIKHCNKALAALFKREVKDLIGLPLKSVIADSPLMEIVKTGRKEVARKIVIEGKTFVSNRTPIYIDGKIVGAVALLQDISELEQISSELAYTKEISQELDAIIESSFDGIFVTDGEGRVLKVNRAYERIAGIKKEYVLGRYMSDLVREGVYNESVTLKVLKSKQVETIVQKVATGKTILVTGNPIFDENGSIFRVVTNVRDITELNELQEKLQRLEDMRFHYEKELLHLKQQMGYAENMVCRSQEMQKVLSLTLQLAQVDSTVLIQGESGTGKELIADIIHKNSMRRNFPFIKINCAAIPENLLETELFGYVEGAFTGAQKGGKPGVFELANGGTIFLDEIGEMPLSLQAKVLRVLQERQIMRVGSSKTVDVDVRIIAATNRNLEEMVRRNSFRADLYYRLNVVPIFVPPLRERRDDIVPLVQFFLDKINKRYGYSKKIDAKVFEFFIKYDWPGNVRELANLVERLVVTTTGEIITCNEIKNYLKNHNNEEPSARLFSDIKPLKEVVKEAEKEVLIKAFARYKTTRKVAQVLQVNQSTVVRKAALYGIKVNE